jgi:hypothetical protein
MVELALIVLTHLKDQRVKPLPHPTNRDVLQRQVISNFQVVRALENLLRFFKPIPRFGFFRNLSLLDGSKWKDTLKV